MAFQRGKPKTGGRKKGTPNRMSAAAREAFALAFNKVGGVDGLQEWARTHRTEFYRLYARLIPVEITRGETPSDAQVVLIGGRPITF